MKKGLWNKRMPTLLAFLLLFISIWVTSYLIQTGVIFIGRATPDKTPQNIKISNITSASFTVSFTTNEKTAGAISFEEAGKNSNLVLDDRNKEKGAQDEFYSHYITIINLTPQTSYNFSVVVDAETYQDGGKKFFVRTAPPINDALLSQASIAGTVILPDGNASQDTIVELNIPQSQFITTLTGNAGEFNIPTNAIRKDNLSSYIKISPETPITITLRRQDLSSTVKALFQNAESLGSLTLGQDYDFTQISEIESATESSVLRAPTSKVTPGSIRILTPRENESFVDSRPRFGGTALPNQKVKIKIESEVIIDEVTADASGTWNYRPSKALSPGQHKITIETIDSFGVIKTITQSFTVFASGSQIAESATPSAAPTIAPTPIISGPTSTPIPTLALTATPTPSQIPILTPTISPLTPIPTQIPVITPAPTGSNSTLILTIISALLIFAGSALLFAL